MMRCFLLGRFTFDAAPSGDRPHQKKWADDFKRPSADRSAIRLAGEVNCFLQLAYEAGDNGVWPKARPLP